MNVTCLNALNQTTEDDVFATHSPSLETEKARALWQRVRYLISVGGLNCKEVPREDSVYDVELPVVVLGMAMTLPRLSPSLILEKVLRQLHANNDLKHVSESLVCDKNLGGFFAAGFWHLLVQQFRSQCDVEYVDALRVNCCYFFTVFSVSHREVMTDAWKLDFVEFLATALHISLHMLFPFNSAKLGAGVSAFIRRELFSMIVGLPKIQKMSATSCATSAASEMNEEARVPGDWTKSVCNSQALNKMSLLKKDIALQGQQIEAVNIKSSNLLLPPRHGDDAPTTIRQPLVSRFQEAARNLANGHARYTNLDEIHRRVNFMNMIADARKRNENDVTAASKGRKIFARNVAPRKQRTTSTEMFHSMATEVHECFHLDSMSPAVLTILSCCATSAQQTLLSALSDEFPIGVFQCNEKLSVDALVAASTPAKGFPRRVQLPPCFKCGREFDRYLKRQEHVAGGSASCGICGTSTKCKPSFFYCVMCKIRSCTSCVSKGLSGGSERKDLHQLLTPYAVFGKQLCEQQFLPVQPAACVSSAMLSTIFRTVVKEKSLVVNEPSRSHLYFQDFAAFKKLTKVLDHNTMIDRLEEERQMAEVSAQVIRELYEPPCNSSEIPSRPQSAPLMRTPLSQTPVCAAPLYGSMIAPTPLARPSSAASTGSRLITRSISRPVSATVRCNTPSSNPRPSSALSRSTHSLSNGRRAAKAIHWSGTQHLAAAVQLHRREEVQRRKAEILERVGEINSASEAAATRQKAQAQRQSAVDARNHIQCLQDIKKGLRDLRLQRDTVLHTAINEIIKAVELTAVPRQVLEHMDCIKESLLVIRQHFLSLPEAMKKDVVVYIFNQRARLKELTTQFKLQYHKKWMWPRSLNDPYRPRRFDNEEMDIDAALVMEQLKEVQDTEETRRIEDQMEDCQLAEEIGNEDALWKHVDGESLENSYRRKSIEIFATANSPSSPSPATRKEVDISLTRDGAHFLEEQRCRQHQENIERLAKVSRQAVGETMVSIGGSIVWQDSLTPIGTAARELLAKVKLTRNKRTLTDKSPCALRPVV